MRLQVQHRTAYRYDAPIPYAIQNIRLSPRPFRGLRVIRWSIKGETGNELPSYIDGYGNIIHCHTVNRWHQQAAIVVSGEVETHDTHGMVSAQEPLPPFFFRRTTPLTEPCEALRALAAEGEGLSNLLDRLHDLMERIPQRVIYEIGETHAATTASEALAAGRGVCQDHAHVFIACARLLNVPARYVSGYLWTGSEENFEASHAWAEAFVPDLGWVGFDPANGVSPTAAYVRTAVGLDYWSAAPLRGLRQGTARETLEVSVQVAAVAGQGQSQSQQQVAS